MSWKDQVAFVTGASQGIGQACALAFGEVGAKVVVAARNAEKLAETVKQLEAAGSEALAVPMDLAQPEQIAAPRPQTRWVTDRSRRPQNSHRNRSKTSGSLRVRSAALEYATCVR